jgi:glucosamine-6-phosphate deaminase
MLQRHPHATVYLDAAAAEELTRVKTPWLLGEIEWTRALEMRAVVWLSQATGKSMLKLEDVDYREPA